jgi:hypothetical protein
MSQRIIDWKTGVQTTVNAASVIVCASDVIPDNSVVELEITLSGRETTSLTNFGEIASTTFLMQARRVSGVLTLVNVPVILKTFAQGSDAALAAATATVDVNANSLRLNATGVIGFTIEWFGSMRIWIN